MSNFQLMYDMPCGICYETYRVLPGTINWAWAKVAFITLEINYDCDCEETSPGCDKRFAKTWDYSERIEDVPNNLIFRCRLMKSKATDCGVWVPLKVFFGKGRYKVPMKLISAPQQHTEPASVPPPASSS